MGERRIRVADAYRGADLVPAAIIMYLTAPKATREEDPAVSRS
jgi:hypothetical protein